MHRQIASPDTLELGLDLLFGRVEDDRTALAENEFLDLDEPEKRAVPDAARVDLVNLSLVHEDDFVECFVCHGCGCGVGFFR